MINWKSTIAPILKNQTIIEITVPTKEITCHRRQVRADISRVKMMLPELKVKLLEITVKHKKTKKYLPQDFCSTILVHIET